MSAHKPRIMDQKVIIQTSPLVSISVSLALSVLFVASLHVWRICGYADKSRNDADTIRRRFASTLLSCVFAACVVGWLAEPVRGVAGELALTPAELFGLRAAHVQAAASLQCLALTAALFLGPLAQHLAAAREGYVPLVAGTGDTAVVLRDWLLAPLTEEFFFRTCLVRLWDSAGLPALFIAVGGPWFFALAHSHHFLEHVRRNDDKRLALAQVGFQVFYTSLFGMYASFLLLRTSSTVAVFLAHAFCNHQGFPDARVLIDPKHHLSHHRLPLAAAYFLGIVAFCFLLVPLTADFAPLYQCMLARVPIEG